MKYLKDGCAHRKEVPDMKRLFIHTCCLLLVISSAAQQKTTRSPLTDFLRDPLFKSAHVGVSVYDPLAKKSLYDYQSHKFFVPASNVKIVSCFAAMKYLDSLLPGIRYYENDTAIYILPTGDPTLLHRDFMRQPVIEFLQRQKKKIYITDRNWRDKELGAGWSWDDYADDYMAERNAFPVYGNTLKWVQQRVAGSGPSDENTISVFSDPEVNWSVRFEPDSAKQGFKVKRDRLANIFSISESTEDNKEVYVPFITGGLTAALELLPDTIGKTIAIQNDFLVTDPQKRTVWSQPLDSVLRHMMYNSDNFFAEQLLLMVADKKAGVMDDALIIDSLLNTDLVTLPDTPVWVDGCGLSRYNLFSPADFVQILDSMRLQFGMERVKSIFPTGDSGTLKHYYVADNGFIYAKTGSMSGVIALSGFLYNRQGRLLIFSVMVNNYNGSGAAARRSIERFVKRLRS
jgi:D-alanyl-D-alanine carboxypeptidase/D-alanyl-D-alanine-endopeptidase (penicillin-binding protein 4)